MVTSNFKHTLKGTSQAPRDQLDRCASLLRICMEVKKAAKVSEDGVVSNKKMEKTDSLVDQICEYVALVADSNRAAPIREEDWKSVQEKAVKLVRLTLPETLAPSMEREMENAVKKDENTAKLCVKAKEKIQELLKKSDRIRIKLSFLSADTDPDVVEYEVKSHMSPSGLATTVLFHRKQGRLPSFYHPYPGPINRTPADWTPKESIPDKLFVVMDRGRLEFKFKITPLCKITNTWVFRNIFVLQKQGRFYLKDSSGILHPAPHGDLIPDRIVCNKVQRPDQKRIEGPISCKQWHETLQRIITAGDEDWIVEPEPLPPPNSCSIKFVPPPFNLATSSHSSTSNVKKSLTTDAIPGGHAITHPPSPLVSVSPGATSSTPHNPPGSVVALNTSASSSFTQDSSTHHRDPLGDTSLTPPSEEKAQTGRIQKVFNWARKKIGLIPDKGRRS